MSWPQGDTPFNPEPAVRRARELWRAPDQMDLKVRAACRGVLMTLGEYVDSLPAGQRHEVALRLVIAIRGT